MDGAEELECEAPASRREGEEVWLDGKTLGQPRIERRAERLEVLRLAADVIGGVAQAA
ncbi:MAG TPA: hypothetical protein VNI55_04620 [Gaiellaceae bacterium]|nr:hypothetical protein [Gaiellaceae bacterium]